MPILRKNWGLTVGESLNFTIDYVSEDDNKVRSSIPLDNYAPRLVFFSITGKELETVREGFGVWRDAPAGHIGIDISPSELAALGVKRFDYILYLDNISVSTHVDPILRGRVVIT